MRILIYQQFHPGHHYKSLHYIIPRLAAVSTDIVVALTAEGHASEEFRTWLEPHAAQVTFDDGLPSGLSRVLKQETWKLHTDLRRAVARLKPDYVLVPSGDAHTGAMGFYRCAGLGPLPGRPPAEVGIHWGRGTAARGIKQQLKDLADHVKLQAAGWTHVHVVNQLFFDAIQKRGSALAVRSRLLPQTAAPGRGLTKTAARRELGIPEDGRLIGLAGDIDRRKAVAELLAAFRAAGTGPSDRVLLAGTLHPMHRQTIARDNGDLVSSGRLIVMDRFLEQQTYQAVFAAADVMAAPYPGFTAASLVILESLAAGRPVIANNLGWCGETVSRFGAGWTCDVLDHADFTRAVRTALASAEAFTTSEAISRLLAFNSPENFAACWLQGVSKWGGFQPPPLRTWSWVTEALGR